MKKQITEKYALMKHKTAILKVIANKTKTSFCTVRQRWFNSKLDNPIPENHFYKILEIIDRQLKFESLEKKHYESFEE
jgi:hypothetical protein